ncbi:MAG: carboxyl-terminal processing protease [Salibacteraceae bacterium]|jgi:carboxyl-terminal processing protease
MENGNRNIVWIPLLVGVCVGLGYWFGFNLAQPKINSKTIDVGNSDFNMLSELLNYIDAEYVDEISKKELIDKTVVSILHELDPHSYYISPEEYAEMNEPLEGNFDGIGIQFNIQNDTLVVIDPIVGGPSEKVGIKAGDRIISVNDSLIAGVGVGNKTVLKLLKGKKGTKVNVTVARKNFTELNFTITRDKIPIHSVSVAYMIDSLTGYIKVDRFGANTTAEFYQGMRKIKSDGAKKVIIDLRGNGGGYMNAATNMLDGFFDKGELLVYTEGKARSKSETKSEQGQEFLYMDVVVLIDESSASASEIFAGAIQDHDRGLVVGRRSFGKGLVQEQTMWPNGSATRLTIARYFTPSGRCIQKPYANGADKYNEDYYHRYETGELLSKDSIEITDSSAYRTDNGRVVYGSGGIIPDVFVPIDTTQGSGYLNQLLYSGLIYDFAFNYTDNHRNDLLSSTNINEYGSSFRIDKGLMDAFIEFTSDKGVAFDENGFERSREVIVRRIKAYIARNIWGDAGFYPIWNNGDKTVQAAIRVNVENALKVYE